MERLKWKGTGKTGQNDSSDFYMWLTQNVLCKNKEIEKRIMKDYEGKSFDDISTYNDMNNDSNNNKNNETQFYSLEFRVSESDNLNEAFAEYVNDDIIDSVKNRAVCFSWLPDILIISLTRYYFDTNLTRNVKLSKKFEFYVKHDFGIFVSDNKGSKDNIFKLQQVINHVGERTDSGHFYSFIDPECNDKWFEFNDSFVTPVTIDKVLKSSYGSENNKDGAYMLVYVRMSSIPRLFSNVDVSMLLSNPNKVKLTKLNEKHSTDLKNEEHQLLIEAAKERIYYINGNMISQIAKKNATYLNFGYGMKHWIMKRINPNASLKQLVSILSDELKIKKSKLVVYRMKKVKKGSIKMSRLFCDSKFKKKASTKIFEKQSLKKAPQFMCFDIDNLVLVNKSNNYEDNIILCVKFFDIAKQKINFCNFIVTCKNIKMSKFLEYFKNNLRDSVLYNNKGPSLIDFEVQSSLFSIYDDNSNIDLFEMFDFYIEKKCSRNKLFESVSEIEKKMKQFECLNIQAKDIKHSLNKLGLKNGDIIVFSIKRKENYSELENKFIRMGKYFCKSYPKYANFCFGLVPVIFSVTNQGEHKFIAGIIEQNEKKVLEKQITLLFHYSFSMNAVKRRLAYELSSQLCDSNIELLESKDKGWTLIEDYPNSLNESKIKDYIPKYKIDKFAIGVRFGFKIDFYPRIYKYLYCYSSYQRLIKDKRIKLLSKSDSTNVIHNTIQKLANFNCVVQYYGNNLIRKKVKIVLFNKNKFEAIHLKNIYFEHIFKTDDTLNVKVLLGEIKKVLFSNCYKFVIQNGFKKSMKMMIDENKDNKLCSFYKYLNECLKDKGCEILKFGICVAIKDKSNNVTYVSGSSDVTITGNMLSHNNWYITFLYPHLIIYRNSGSFSYIDESRFSQLSDIIRNYRLIRIKILNSFNNKESNYRLNIFVGKNEKWKDDILVPRICKYIERSHISIESKKWYLTSDINSNVTNGNQLITNNCCVYDLVDSKTGIVVKFPEKFGLNQKEWDVEESNPLKKRLKIQG